MAFLSPDNVRYDNGEKSVKSLFLIAPYGTETIPRPVIHTAKVRSTRQTGRYPLLTV